MKLKSSLKKISSVALVLFSLNSFAAAPTCPSLDMVQQSWEKLDNIIGPTDQGTYTVYASSPVFDFSKKTWYLATAPIPALSDRIALVTGQENVQYTSTRDTDVAQQVGDELFVCFYEGKFTNTAVLAITMVDDHTKPSPSAFARIKKQ